jgi:serine/threonine-protein kinase
VFEVQDEIAEAITSALKSRLGHALSERAHTPSLAAYEPFLRGRAQLIRFTPDAWNRAENYFAQAIALDPQYSEPRAELALGRFITGMHGMRAMREVAPDVRLEAEQALALNPNDERPRFLLGAVALVHDYDWEAAADHFAASMHSANVPAHALWIHASLYLRGLGRFEESAEEMARAVEQDPLNATWHSILAAHLLDLERFDQAMASALKATEIEPNYFVAQHLLGESYWWSGRRDEAMAAFERAYGLAPWNAVAAGWLAIAHAHAGRPTKANELIAQMGDTPAPMWGRTVYHLMTGDLDAAADWFERMIDQRDPFALVYARAAVTAPLRAHKRWPRLASLMRLPPAA